MTEQDLQMQSEQLIEEARREIEEIKAVLAESRRRSETPDHAQPVDGNAKPRARTN